MLSIARSNLWQYTASLVVLVQLGMSVLGLWTDQLWILALLPTLALFGIVINTSIRVLYLILFAMIPFSIEMEISGIGLDFPGELLLLIITAISGLLLIRDRKSFSLDTWGYLLLIHLAWGWVCTLFAEHPMLSTKFMIAKMWYVVPFYFAMHYAVRSITDWNRLMRFFVISVALVGTYSFVRHGMVDWAFDQRMYAGTPFMRNHVNYACMLLLSLPICTYLYQQKGKKRYVALGLLLLFYSYFAYARIVYLSLGLMVSGLLALRWRLLPTAILVAAVVSIGLLTYTLSSDRLVEMAPEYTKTISHDRFGEMVSATYDGQDISTMERLHRWVAGLEMNAERPFFGFGPSNFYSCYQEYTINSFQTYVSDNPERSGVHSYYLMLLVEQGWIGLLLFLFLLVFALIEAHQRYSTSSVSERQLLQLAVSWLVLLVSINLLNDMIEVIKVGPFFFMVGFLLFGTKKWHSDTYRKINDA